MEENESERILIVEIENYSIYKQTDNPYGNGYELYKNDKFIGAWDTLDGLFRQNN